MRSSQKYVDGFAMPCIEEVVSLRFVSDGIVQSLRSRINEAPSQQPIFCEAGGALSRTRRAVLFVVEAGTHTVLAYYQADEALKRELTKDCPDLRIGVPSGCFCGIVRQPRSPGRASRGS